MTMTMRFTKGRQVVETRIKGKVVGNSSLMGIIDQSLKPIIEIAEFPFSLEERKAILSQMINYTLVLERELRAGGYVDVNKMYRIEVLSGGYMGKKFERNM